jgi:peptidoglycan-associated lipoprotein
VGAVLLVVLAGVTGCGKKQPPVARPVPPPMPTTTTPPPAPPRPPAPPEPVVETPAIVPPDPSLATDTLSNKPLDELNRNSPLQPVYFEYDSADVSAVAQASLNTNAELLKKYATWVVTIEGHCDERGSAEYNLALGERRSIAARNYLVSLGIPADRLRTVSYGKEFPFDPGHTDAAWSKNRRAHFVITAK